MYVLEFLKSVFYKNNLETLSAAIKISSFGPLIFGKQKGSEEHIITIVYRNMGSNYRNFLSFSYKKRTLSLTRVICFSSMWMNF